MARFSFTRNCHLHYIYISRLEKNAGRFAHCSGMWKGVGCMDVVMFILRYVVHLCVINENYGRSLYSPLEL